MPIQDARSHPPNDARQTPITHAHHHPRDTGTKYPFSLVRIATLRYLDRLEDISTAIGFIGRCQSRPLGRYRNPPDRRASADTAADWSRNGLAVMNLHCDKNPPTIFQQKVNSLLTN